jgi:RNA polymerase subunit RPABC4/transcription elongation factor Spt4
MSFVCRQGHYSVSDDFCDVCGVRNRGGGRSAVATQAGVAARACPVCATTQEGEDRYCSSCGYDFVTGERFGPIVPISRPGAEPAPALAPARPAAPSPARRTANPFQLVVVLSVEASRVGQPAGPASPDQPGRVFGLDRSSLVIGRADGAELQIPVHGDPYVSRRHAEIIELGDEWGVRDLGSTNGTRLNGSPLVGAEVRLIGADDVIEVGSCTTLVVRQA